MKKSRLSSIVVLLVLTMMLTACNGTPSAGDVNQPGNSVTPSESDKSDSQKPSQSEEPSEPDSQTPSQSEEPSEPASQIPTESEDNNEPLEDGWSRLTQEELKWFNEQFFNVADNMITNAFLNCTYADVKDISMYELFYDCPNQSTVEISVAEKALLKQSWGEIETDIQKVPASYIDEMLSKYANIKLADTNKFELDKLVYLADYSAYYNVHGDVHYSPVEVKSGVKDANGNVVLQCYRTEEAKEYTVTLKAHENGYYFVSNIVVE